MPHDVIMPALGMAQQTGKIVKWCKQAGDALVSSDILLEVETDKTTMEVEAGADGVLAALLADAGADIPVGDTIAIIAPPGTEIDADRDTGKATRAAPVMEPVRETAPAPKPVPQPRQPANGRILASPKARRIARENDIELADLAAAGLTQPFHARDVQAYQPPSQTAPQPARDRIRARVPRAPSQAMAEHIRAQLKTDISDAAIWAAFAAGALRAKMDAGPFVIEVQRPDPSTALQFDDPDKKGFSRIEALGHHVRPSLIVRDLTAGRILDLRLSSDTAPVLSIMADGDTFAITLDSPAGTLPANAALALVDGFLDRLESPIRHLL